jgi:hypothetical protein
MRLTRLWSWVGRAGSSLGGGFIESLFLRQSRLTRQTPDPERLVPVFFGPYFDWILISVHAGHFQPCRKQTSFLDWQHPCRHWNTRTSHKAGVGPDVLLVRAMVSE